MSEEEAKSRKRYRVVFYNEWGEVTRYSKLFKSFRQALMHAKRKAKYAYNIQTFWGGAE